MTPLQSAAAALTVGLAVALSGGCASSRTADGLPGSIDKAQQTAMTSDQALGRLSEGNHRFVAGTELHRDYAAQRQATATGQYPFAVVLSCIDSRSAPEIVFDQGIGDLFVPRIAGNYAQADILGSMEFATKVAGAKLVVVMGHTECGAIKGACDDVQMGNLTTVIKAIRPAVEGVKDVTTDRTSKNKQFVREVTDMNVRLTIEKIRHDSPIMRGLEESGQIKIVGAMYDVATGRVSFLN